MSFVVYCDLLTGGCGDGGIQYASFRVSGVNEPVA